MRKCIMTLSLVLVGLALILGLGATNRADAQERHEKSGRPCSSIGIVTNFTDNSLYLLDPGTNTLSGPYFKGELGQGNSALNTAVTPGGKTALITNYNAYAVFFVELPHRFGDSPTLPDSVNIGYNAEDVAITPDGKYALITYGGSDPFIAVLDLETRSLRTTYEMPSSMKAAGIEIAPDGQTVLAVDHTNTGIHVLRLDVDGNLTFSHSIALTFQPRSIAVSPDGITAVVVNPSDGSPAVLRIDSPGNVVLVEENIPLSCPYGASAAFSSNGTAAFYLSNNGPGTSIHLLEVPAPGIVSSSSTGINVSPENGEGEVRSGFDSFAVEPSGHYAYVWRKVSHAGNPAGIVVIDLTTQKQVKTLSGVDFPVDITFGCLTTPTKPSKPASDQPPFGTFETPVNGSTVRSSIAVTGWALDDLGVESVKIYRQQGSDLVYIGDALFIEGARPDVEAAYPNYPNNTQAGWGYMMLTNFLPNGGNGTFKIHAIAKDTAGHLVTLGVKTIHCDNANATKPFGAIDSPQPGETISGTNYRITGWVLTPPPNKIPEDGSTINVRIDGQNIGHVTYNIYRSDIATLFPGYTNSNGAHGYIEFDTTQYSNGVHTLEWVATDNAGNTDGVGSRYFSIDNGETGPVEYTIGTDSYTTSKTIGETGDTIEVTNSNSPLYGVTVEFPAGALPEDVVVTLASNNGTLTPNSGTFGGKAISLDVPNVDEFEQPVTIIVPFYNEEGIPVPYYVDSNGKLHPAQLVSIDESNKTFSFQVFHASIFTWIWEAITGQVSTMTFDTGFRPNEDGFQVDNNGSTNGRTAECFGMTSFALWYFMNHKETNKNFYDEYYDDILSYDSAGNELRGQDIIATRAFISISQQWNTYFPTYLFQTFLPDKYKYSYIRNSIISTGNPVLILLFHYDGHGIKHSVLAYAFNYTQGTISIYDPDHPGDINTINYNNSTDTFETYAGYEGIMFIGDGSLHLTEPYQNILDDANADFQGSGDATIQISSHSNGQEVTERNVVLSGIIESGEVLVTKLYVFVGSTLFTTNVDTNGYFNIPLSMKSGVNHLSFETKGLIIEDDVVKLDHVPNNMEIEDFTLNLNVPYAMILMTLTWDKDVTDLDAYVIDPTGDYSCYYHKTTADGGELDYDVTTGYGPEHWTLMSTDTIRYDQPYRFRVHYYSDHGNGPTNYTVSIKLYEETGQEVDYWFRGNLAVSDSWNDVPDDTGPDWDDIASLTLTRADSRSTPTIKFSPGGKINITVPVPSREERNKYKISQ